MTKQRSFTGIEARQLLRRGRVGTLSTLNRESGIPYGSLANYVTDSGGRPVIMVSALAWHTKNLQADPRASLLVAEVPQSGDVLTGARVSVMGRFAKLEDEALSRRYLARHPEARIYAGFGDFAYWRLIPETVHAVAGFGRIETLEASEVFPAAVALQDLEEGALAHMNADHVAAIQRYAAGLGGEAHGKWRMEALDGDGADLSDGSRSLRLEFPEPVQDAAALRAVLAALAKGNIV